MQRPLLLLVAATVAAVLVLRLAEAHSAADGYNPKNPIVDAINPDTAEHRRQGAGVAWDYLYSQQAHDRTPPISPYQFASLKDFAVYAEKNLAKSSWDYYNERGGQGLTYQWNEQDFQKIKFSHRCLVNVSEPKQSLSTTVLGHTISMPIMMSPAAYQALAHPFGEMANARAAAAAGVGYTLSTFSTFPLEDVASAQDEQAKISKTSALRWFQLYHFTDDLTLELVKRAEAAGYTAIVVTADVAYYGNPQTFTGTWYSLPYPWDPANMREWALKHGGVIFDDPTWELKLDAGLTWSTVSWLRQHTRLPIIVKGIQRSDDAVRAVKAGASAVWVSNHGARHLDTCPSTISSLASVVKAVRDMKTVDGGRTVEVYVDGGVRSGLDVIKALALGARCVMIGRPPLWGLAVGGQAGVEAVLKLLREDLLLGLTLNGTPNVSTITPDAVIVPDGFNVPFIPYTYADGDVDVERDPKGAIASYTPKTIASATKRHRLKAHANQNQNQAKA